MKIESGIASELYKTNTDRQDIKPSEQDFALKKKSSEDEISQNMLPKEFSEATVSESIESINEYTKLREVGLLLKVDRDLDNRIIVKMVDRESQEIIKQIPSKEAVELALHLKKVFENKGNDSAEPGRFLNDIA